MFTGIIATTGLIQSRETRDGDLRMRFDVPQDLMVDSKEGDSISVSGVCLTMLEPNKNGFSADVSVETLDKTSLGSRSSGDHVNLELALRASDRLGGHMVSGHVDGLAVDTWFPAMSMAWLNFSPEPKMPVRNALSSKSIQNWQNILQPKALFVSMASA